LGNIRNESQSCESSFEFQSFLGSVCWNEWHYKRLPCSIEQVKKYISDPMFYNRKCRDLAWWAYNSNGVIRNTVDYMCAIPTLDRIVCSKNKSCGKYRENKAKFVSVLDMIKDKEIVRDSILRNCNDAVAFYYFVSEETGDNTKTLFDSDVDGITELNSRNGFNCSLFSLPVDYCRIIGIRNSSYQIAFDLSYFNQFDGNGKAKKIRIYPKEIREAWKNYNKSSGTGQWVILDNNKTIVTKVGSMRSEPWGRPIALAAFDNIIYSDYFTDTKRHLLDEINNKLVYQEFPEGKEKGTSALTETQQKNQHDTVKMALNNRKEGQRALAFVSLAAGSKLNTLDVDTNIFDEKNEAKLRDDIAADVGFAASLLNGSSQGSYSTQQTNLELVSAELFSWIKQFQAELNKVINANVIKTENCYVEVDYLPVTFANKDKVVKYAKELYMSGKGSLQAWISSCGFNFDSYVAMMDEELADDYENKYPVHKTSFTMTGDERAGRPNEENPKNDNTIKSQASGGNNQPKPSD